MLWKYLLNNVWRKKNQFLNSLDSFADTLYKSTHYVSIYYSNLDIM